MDRTEKYLKEKNIDVVFNALGSTENLVNLYIKENYELVKLEKNKTSNFIKQQCYDQYYKMKPRTKYTGFEKVTDLDKKTRLKMMPFQKGLLGTILEKNEYDKTINGSYIEELKNSFKNLKNPFLYLSGGIDSEFVALAMLESNIQFTPVIFQWMINHSVINIHDINYAIKFCNEKNLNPIIEQIKLDELWNNDNFILLSKETNNSSPQVNTYVYMVEMMDKKYPNRSHVLGGEVRFQLEDQEYEKSNLIYAAKVNPLTANGVTYNNTYVRDSGGNYSSTNYFGIKINFDWDGSYANNQNWQITAYVQSLTQDPGIGSGNEVPVTSGTPTSGTWFNADTPGGGGWEMRASYNNGSTWTSWYQIIPGNGTTGYIYFYVWQQGAGNSDSGGTYPVRIEIRSVSQPGIVSVTNFSVTIFYVSSGGGGGSGFSVGGQDGNILLNTAENSGVGGSVVITG